MGPRETSTKNCSSGEKGKGKPLFKTTRVVNVARRSIHSEQQQRWTVRGETFSQHNSSVELVPLNLYNSIPVNTFQYLLFQGVIYIQLHNTSNFFFVSAKIQMAKLTSYEKKAFIIQNDLTPDFVQSIWACKTVDLLNTRKNLVTSKIGEVRMAQLTRSNVVTRSCS